MTSSSNERMIRIPLSVKTRLIERSPRRGFIADVMRTLTAEYAAGVGAEEPADREPDTERTKFHIEDDVWAKAQKRAEDEGTTLPKVLRKRLARYVAEL